MHMAHVVVSTVGRENERFRKTVAGYIVRTAGAMLSGDENRDCPTGYIVCVHLYNRLSPETRKFNFDVESRCRSIRNACIRIRAKMVRQRSKRLAFLISSGNPVSKMEQSMLDEFAVFKTRVWKRKTRIVTAENIRFLAIRTCYIYIYVNRDKFKYLWKILLSVCTFNVYTCILQRKYQIDMLRIVRVQ